MRKLFFLALFIALPLRAADICPANPPVFSELSSGSLISTANWDALVSNSRFFCQGTVPVSNYWNFADGRLEIPRGTGASEPADCETGELFKNDDANALHVCGAPDLWVGAILDSGTIHPVSDFWEVQSPNTHQGLVIADNSTSLYSLSYVSALELDNDGKLTLYGNGAGSVPSCGAGEFWLSPFSSSNTWKACYNGTIGEVGNIQAVMKLTPTASPPGSPAEGMLYSDTSHAICWYDGSGWVKLGGAGTCS